MLAAGFVLWARGVPLAVPPGPATGRLLHGARQAKHAAHVAAKRTRRGARAAKFDVATVLFRDVERLRPYRYRTGRYPGSFLEHTEAPEGPRQVPERVFVVWTGGNALTPNRERGLAALRSRLEVPLVLVTPHTLDEWLVADHPLHPAYEHLSLVHRSDYLRAYLLHHHGGGYVDVKEPRGSWRAAFARAAADPDRWLTSYRTTHANWIGKLPGRLGLDILVHHRLMVGKGSLIARSRTPLTAEWLAAMDRLLDATVERLEHHPGGVYGDDPLYPLSWTDLLGRVLDPLTLKYLAHVGHDDDLLLDFHGYR